MNFFLRHFIGGMLIALIVFGFVFPRAEKWVFLKLVEQGGHHWEPLSRELTSDSMNLNHEENLEVSLSNWVETGSGFERCWLTVTVAGRPLERIRVAKVDPRQFEFRVYWEPNGYRDVDEWADYLGADAVINGSYYGKNAAPVTPVVSFGHSLGPSNYVARHGAFVVTDDVVDVVDLVREPWSDLMLHAKHAIVSYPLLVDENGNSRTQNTRPWIANRSFIAIDFQGNILFGTSELGPLTLSAFAKVLKSAPLDIKVALNLDGGPVAGLALRANRQRESIYGLVETQGLDEENQLRLTPGIKGKKWSLPIVLAAFRRTANAVEK